MTHFSRFAKEKFVYTSPKQDVSKFVRDVNRNCVQFDADCIFPTSEAAIMACSKYRDELLCPAIIPRPAEIETVFSKANTLEVASALGIAIPRTIYVTNANREVLDSVSLPFPIVVKSESSAVMFSEKASASESTFYAYNKNELQANCESRLARGQSVLLQEFIDGYGIGVSGLFAHGQPVALLAHRRIRESNPMGGSSALAETI